LYQPENQEERVMKNLSKAWIVVGIAGTMMMLTGSSAYAQSYPNRPITLIYPYPAGSTTDAAWRTIALEAGKHFGQSIVFENRAGAGGRIGLDAVRRAPKDGYTLGIMNNGLSVFLPQINPSFVLEPHKDYSPIVFGNESYLVWVSSTSAPFRNVKELIAYAKANPGKLNFASAGVGTGSHLGMEMFKSMAGVDITAVHYKGEAPAVTALMTGEAHLALPAAGARSFVESGKIVALATSGRQRWSVFPNLPTIAEAGGLTRYAMSFSLGVIGPADLPPEVIARANAAFNAALNSSEVRTRLESAGWVIKGGTPGQFVEAIRAEQELYRPIIRAANIKLD